MNPINTIAEAGQNMAKRGFSVLRGGYACDQLSKSGKGLRGRTQKPNWDWRDHPLRYAALELRFAMEALTYDAGHVALFRLVPVSDSLLDMVAGMESNLPPEYDQRASECMHAT
ncbi:hypothetical protein GOC38_28835 [Sinorhizobium meliloti]|nr:hypothetical protein [Sinorhizobium meliloti]MDX0321582.1 hypothetical protein [Sinorhizobium meliloti]MDX0328012.1 hypothetical protein [Sinorhizobium meliloti]